jgi:hypothetical protein
MVALEEVDDEEWVRQGTEICPPGVHGAVPVLMVSFQLRKLLSRWTNLTILGSSLVSSSILSLLAVRCWRNATQQLMDQQMINRKIWTIIQDLNNTGCGQASEGTDCLRNGARGESRSDARIKRVMRTTTYQISMIKMAKDRTRPLT